VLTSRFVFADLERHLGTAFHQLELPGLGTREGATLLAQLGVRGPSTDREEISERLDGHPLGLRVFSGALPDPERDSPRAFLDHALHGGGLSRGASLNDKVLRLLDFYEKQLPADQARLLSIVSLFRSPVAQHMILRLARGLFSDDARLSDDVAVIAALRKLYNDHILTLEPIEGGQGYAAHPILRDHFRGILLRGDAEMARRAADLLQEQPSQREAESVKEIEPVLIAIELLLDAGEFETADELYRERLRNGRPFLTLPAVPEGLACALGFVLNEHRRKQVQEKLSWGRLGFYLNEVGLWASISGHYEFALSYYSDANTIDREHGDARNLGTGLQNEAELLHFLGRVTEAFRSADAAVRLAIGARNEHELRDAFARRGWVAFVAGRVVIAAEDFARANLLEMKNDPEGDELYGSRDLQWSQLLFYSGHPEVAARRTAVNLRICERFNLHGSVASCHAMLARCALADGKFDDAEAELRIAEPVFRRGQILYELARLKIIAGEVALARKDAQGALHEAAEALALAAPRSMRLVHADALILRGKARAVANERMRACDDAREGLRLARDCSYPWAERAALRLLAEITGAVTHADATISESDRVDHARADARTFRDEAEAISARLILTKEDLTAAEEKATTWLAERDKAQRE
jgi:tetratricopeptide (TPR) repeat protein